MSEEITGGPEAPEPHHSEAPADAANVVQGDFGGTTAPETQAQEEPLSGSGLPEAYAKALEPANTHHIFGEIKNHVANFGYTMLSGFKALEHILLRDQSAHADASSAWDRVKAALKQAGAEFTEEEEAISHWFRISDPRPPIIVQPQNGSVATAPGVAAPEPAAEPPTPEVTPEAAPPVEATTEQPSPESPVV